MTVTLTALPSLHPHYSLTTHSLGHLSGSQEQQQAVVSAVSVLLKEKINKLSGSSMLLKAFHAILLSDMLQDLDAADPLLLTCVDHIFAVCEKHPKQLSLIVDGMGAIAALLLIEAEEEEEGAGLAQRCLKASA